MRTYILLSLTGLGLFLLGAFISPYVEKYVPEFIFVSVKETPNDQLVPPIDQENEEGITNNVDPELIKPLVIKNTIESDLTPSIYNRPGNKNHALYKTQKSIIEKYKNGNREEKIVQLYLYLSSLEGRSGDYKKAEAELCSRDAVLCAKIKMPLEIKGKITDTQNKPISGAKISVVGESYVAESDTSGDYTIQFTSLHPRRIRLLVNHPEFSGGTYTFVTVDPRISVETETQHFVQNFSLQRAVKTVTIHTEKRSILAGDAKITEKGYFVQTDFSQYLVPFDAIKDTHGVRYKGEVQITVFEFSRENPTDFLSADVFSDIGFASEGLRTYSMPFIVFHDKKGEKLHVFKNDPMTVWTTNRELEALILENSQGKHNPGFNPLEYDENASPEKVRQYIGEDENLAYTESMKNVNKYSITLDWIDQHKSRLPGFFVMDQRTGFWEPVGYSLVQKSASIPYSIQSLFWTTK